MHSSIKQHLSSGEESLSATPTAPGPGGAWRPPSPGHPAARWRRTLPARPAAVTTPHGCSHSQFPATPSNISRTRAETQHQDHPLCKILHFHQHCPSHTSHSILRYHEKALRHSAWGCLVGIARGETVQPESGALTRWPRWWRWPTRWRWWTLPERRQQRNEVFFSLWQTTDHMGVKRWS